MYWIPAILIFIEMFYIFLIGDVVNFINANILSKKYKDKKLTSYIDDEYHGELDVFFTLIILLFFEFVYLVVGLFYYFWIFSIIIIFISAFEIIYSQVNNFSIEKIIKLANLKNVELDVKLDRLMKLQEINNGSEVKINRIRKYFLPILKIALFILIIILPHGKLDTTIHELGYYKYEITIENNDEKKTHDTYKCKIYVNELEKYDNGTSKIQLQKIDIISGFDHNKYESVKTMIKEKFVSIKETDDVTWLNKISKTKQ